MTVDLLFHDTHQAGRRLLDENWSTELYHISFFQIFHVELK